MLLRVLYDNLQHKSNILLGKKVTGVATIGACVQVQTRDGSIFNGDIVVGADGIHSIVRQEMRRIASELSPEYFPADELSRKYIIAGIITLPNKEPGLMLGCR